MIDAFLHWRKHTPAPTEKYMPLTSINPQIKSKWVNALQTPNAPKTEKFVLKTLFLLKKKHTIVFLILSYIKTPKSTSTTTPNFSTAQALMAKNM